MGVNVAVILSGQRGGSRRFVAGWVGKGKLWVGYPTHRGWIWGGARPS